MFSALWNWLFGQRQTTNIVKLSQLPSYAGVFAEHGPDMVDEQVSGEEGERYEVEADLNSKVSLYHGDITCLEVDGIVRSTNKTLDSPEGISGVILRAAGKDLNRELATLEECHPGKVVTSGGYLLPAKYIVHTVGERNPQVLKSCYEECFKRMLEKEMKSLAFCCISTGIGGYPNDKAAVVALRTVRWSLEQLKREENLQKIDRIIFCVFSDTDLLLYKQWMQFFFPCPPVQAVQERAPEPDIFAPNPSPADDRVDRVLQPLDGIELTLEPCIVTFEDDPETWRARMPCGHVIAPSAMAEYCKSEVRKGRFVCPVPDCKAEWPYFVVRHVACLTENEMRRVEQQLADAVFDRKKEFKRCLRCHTVCYRAPGTGNCVRCPTCSAARATGAGGGGGRRRYDFCWICLSEWKSLMPYFSCGNPLCGGKDKIQILANCRTKRIDFCSDCPAIRACPRCGRLIEHASKCGHVECPNCTGFGFCFICLTGNSGGKWKCWPYLGSCKLAPRQTHLP